VASAFFAIRAIAVLLQPFVPRFAGSVLSVMGIETPTWELIRSPVGGLHLGPERVLLERIEVETLREQVEGNTAPDVEDERKSRQTVPFEAFQSLDLRIGRIVAAEPVEDADRLLRLSVDLGSETRVCVAGIRGRYDPEGLVGRRIAVVVNLEPATIRGIRSECMLLAASDEDGPALLAVDRDVDPGTRIS
jgi:methionyl-tRNA synthetase